VQDETYAIDLSRAFEAGESRDVELRSGMTMTMEVSVPGADAKPATTAEGMHFLGRMDVLEVDPKGVPTSLALHVTTFEAADGSELLAKGSTVHVKRGETEVEVTTDGAALSEAARKAVVVNFPPLKNEKGLVDEDVFGSKVRRKVGETWAIDAAHAVDISKALVGSTNPDPKASGEMKLVGVERAGTGKVLHIAGGFTVTNLRGALEQGVAVRDGTVVCTFDAHFPAEDHAMARDTSMSLNVHRQMARADGSPAGTMDVRVEDVQKYGARLR
jgi:hypothetical protein